MKISVFGLGYVGGVSCGCLTALGHEIVGVDVNAAKVEMINQGIAPVSEPGLDGLVADGVAVKRLWATTHGELAVRCSDAAMLCVGTPSTRDGSPSADQLETVCREIGIALRDRREPFTVFVRSTALPPTHDRLVELLETTSGHAVGGPILRYVCHPEFLREGTAVRDFHDPPHIVFGISNDGCRDVCAKLYPALTASTCYVSPAVAAMLKYASNCFHAVKVTFGNEIGMLARQYGIDARTVMELFCEDRKLNISPQYLKPGAPLGGSCLPKDVRAVLNSGRNAAIDLPLLEGTLISNNSQIDWIVARLSERREGPIGVVGLAFKEGTDDVRESPLVRVVEALLARGHPVTVYDAHLSVSELVGTNRCFALKKLPHLAELLTGELREVVATAGTLLVAHKLSEEAWAEVLPLCTQHRILDLAGVRCLRDQAGYEGLYW